MNTLLVAELVWPVSMVGGLWALVLFGLYPGHVEAVASIAARADLLMALGVLLTCWGLQRRSRLVVVAGVVIAALSKEPGIMALPLAMLLAWQLARPMSMGVVTIAGVMALGLGAGLVHQFGWSLAAPVDIGRRVVETGRLLLWPWPLRIDYAWEWVTPTIALAVGVSAIAGTALYLFGEQLFFIETGWVAWVGFAVAWTLTALLPRLLVPSSEPLHLHHLYVPWVGVSLALASVFTSKESLYVA